ncbi:hypothetical protein C2869_18695 [Saccharobesus litoralis]|uniref:Uncharacterized protein n=1 Tax=Saccharobesus litoralis TaxID=2172099 RepID=A0A2S0VW28_9ALTE|nr:hypothetical protein [Saccharobesus litoralis]AWB68310.1 hypothetical protein C2869_18695 [Saccharobesus litoralis]
MKNLIKTSKYLAMISALLLNVSVIAATVSTPMGTSVTVLERAPLTSSQVAAYNQSFLDSWPYAQLIEDASSLYNCHSFAFYWFNPANPYWMNDPSAYWQDGSYNVVTDGSLAYRDNIEYYENGQLQHSGPVYSYNNGVIGVLSKWGSWPIAYHHYLYTPYTLETSNSTSYIPGISLQLVRKAY